MQLCINILLHMKVLKQKYKSIKIYMDEKNYSVRMAYFRIIYIKLLDCINWINDILS